jgi:hypothetical protein
VLLLFQLELKRKHGVTEPGHVRQIEKSEITMLEQKALGPYLMRNIFLAHSIFKGIF